MYTTLNYSPNFEPKKRKLSDIKFIIFHYTGMRSEKSAINKLTNKNSKVSCHYFIKNNGEVLTLVPDLYTSWHAGISSWKKFKFLNNNSIGIEINNPGHNYKYKKFSKKQINSVLKLSKFLIKKYKIKSTCILGHSDIAPSRKKDPGEKFPWKYLSENKIGYWHNLNQDIILKKRNINLEKKEKLKFVHNLYKIGYSKNYKLSDRKHLKLITTAFQRRFRQQLVNGIIDLECLLISNNIVKKIKFS
ncbi:N-acetylmuramoyl-L-alanine amidase [Candidatus Pelagibacter sp. FZCC0015]|uniref:N-acetylmuramoyl-L-alanine amidase n=1 Tax=Candidatus Pelagibacter sp. FZCC0015 TaxID=2268451 RepID=UPI0011A01743|nr:N-acetylmuramoyl-L-alanine amidase [Candidatus Pelagibacter sp. FZCC0015]